MNKPFKNSFLTLVVISLVVVVVGMVAVVVVVTGRTEFESYLFGWGEIVLVVEYWLAGD